MKSLHPILIIVFALSSLSLSAQVHYSQVLEQIFVGPENVITYNSEVNLGNQQTIMTAIEHLESLDDSEQIRLNQTESDSSSIDIDSELISLKNILTAWQSLPPDDSKLSPNQSDKEQSIGSRVRLPFKNPEQYRTVTLPNGQVKTIELEASFTKWNKCGGMNKNCLSTDPNDCLTWQIEESRFIFVDSQGFAIPFDTIKKFYTQFRILDDAVECRIK